MYDQREIIRTRLSLSLLSLLLALLCQPITSFQQFIPRPGIQNRHFAGIQQQDSVFVLKAASNEIDMESMDSSNDIPNKSVGRKEFLSSVLLGSVGVWATTNPQLANAAENAQQAQPQQFQQLQQEDGQVVYKTNSGLKYLELEPGTGPSPRYGQLCAIQYTGYLKLPTERQPQKFDSNNFLIKHGNGRMIAGLDEGLHTMKVGGKRRLIIPPKLGYVESGLGPIPELPWNRWTLNSLLNKMVEQRGGNLVFEVTLLSVMDDEADQGYYEDGSPTPEEFEKLRLNFQERAAAAAAASANQ